VAPETPRHRPFTLRQQRENARFLAALRRTGNVRLACRELGVHRSTYTKRRARCAAFATNWDATLAAAHAAFRLAGGERMPEANPPLPLQGRGTSRREVEGPLEASAQNLRTRGGEPTIVRQANGRLQLRLAPPGRMTKAAEQAFFAALSATANIRLSAAAAGFAHSSFYARRAKGGAFAREMRLSLKIGWQRLEAALLAAGLPESHADDAWREDHDMPPIPPMTPDQALQLLVLHDKSVNLSWEQPHRRKRRGEPWETYTERLRAMWRAEKGREAEEEALRRAAHYEETGDWRLPDEPAPPPALPPLELVTGWSKAQKIKVIYSGRALFGGWRLDNREKRNRPG
jgi:hypothetical protein